MTQETNTQQPDECRQPSRITKEEVKSTLEGLAHQIELITTLEELEESAGTVLDGLPEAQIIRTKIGEALRDGRLDDEARLVAEQARLYHTILAELSLMTGIEHEQARVDRENGEYLQNLQERFVDTNFSQVGDDELLQMLGFLRTSETSDEQVFNFPDNFFPPHIHEKWDHYIDIVKNHHAALNNRHEGGVEAKDPTSIMLLDAIRTRAHDNLSLAIGEYLKLDGWDKAKYRRLVAKMRDKRLPTLETSEKGVTADSIRRVMVEVGRLASHKKD